MSEFESLSVGQVGKLAVPAEDVGGDYDDGGEDIDTSAGMVPLIGRPRKEEWCTLFVGPAMLRTRLLRIQKDEKGFNVDFYYVDKAIRPQIAEYVKPFRIVPYYSWLGRRFGLWITAVAEPGSSGWADTMDWLLTQTPSWHAERALLITSDRAAGRYRFRGKQIPGKLPSLASDTSTLLGAAIGPTRFLSDPNHPAILKLLEGEEVGI